MTNPKRHHIIPEMLQKRFVDHDGYIYVFDKRHSDRNVIGTCPKNSFVESHIYSEIDGQGNKDPHLEHYYSKIEGAADPIVEKIVSTARSDRVPSLTTLEKRQWDDFFHHQWKRSPDFYENAMTEPAFERSLERITNEIEEEIRPLISDERAFLSNPDNKDRLRRNARIQALESPGPIICGRGGISWTNCRPHYATEQKLHDRQPSDRALRG